jgi:hypothetical protein
MTTAGAGQGDTPPGGETAAGGETPAASNTPAAAPDPSSLSTRAIEGFKSLGFFTADYAAVESGKIYAAGGYWSILRFPAFPAVLPAASIVAVVQVPFHANQADHSFEFSLENADRRRLPQFRVEGSFRSAPTIDTRYGEPGIWPLAVPIYGLVFENAGEYSFAISIDQREIGRYSFRVVQVAATGAVLPPTAVG